MIYFIKLNKDHITCDYNHIAYSQTYITALGIQLALKKKKVLEPTLHANCRASKILLQYFLRGNIEMQI